MMYVSQLFFYWFADCLVLNLVSVISQSCKTESVFQIIDILHRIDIPKTAHRHMFNNVLKNVFLLFLRYYAIIKAKLEIYLHRVNHWLTNTSSDKTSNSNWFIQKYSRFITRFDVVCSFKTIPPISITQCQSSVPFNIDPTICNLRCFDIPLLLFLYFLYFCIFTADNHVSCS